MTDWSGKYLFIQLAVKQYAVAADPKDSGKTRTLIWFCENVKAWNDTVLHYTVGNRWKVTKWIGSNHSQTMEQSVENWLSVQDQDVSWTGKCLNIPN